MPEMDRNIGHKRFIRIVRSSLQKMVLNSGEGRFDTSYIERT